MRGEARTAVGDVEMSLAATRSAPSSGATVRCAGSRAPRRDAGLEIVERSRVLDGRAGRRARARRNRARQLRGAKCWSAPTAPGSRVRAAVFGAGKETIGRALMTDIPVDPERTPEFVEQRYRFDFRCVQRAESAATLVVPMPHRRRAASECWHLRSASARIHRDGRRAVADAGRAARGFSRIAARRVCERHATRCAAFPIRWFDARDSYVRGRVILAGDAAGVDPLMGEGISCAFEHGKLAAHAIGELLARRSAPRSRRTIARCIAARSARSWASSRSRRAISTARIIGSISESREHQPPRAGDRRRLVQRRRKLRRDARRAR